MKRTYRGSCHCGFVRFTVEADLDHVRSCDCWICRRRGALIHRVQPDAFHLETSLDNLTLYTFNTHTARDYFCPRCGILPFRRPQTEPGAWGINVRCLDSVDLDAVRVTRVFGSQLSSDLSSEERPDPGSS